MSFARLDRQFKPMIGPTPTMSALSPDFEPPPPPSESFTATHALTLILTVVLLLLFFVGFFSIYFCRCFMENLMNILNNRRNPMGAPVNPTNTDPPGLDQAIIDSFPSFDYSSVKDYRRENYSLECAICLSEFHDDDILRLIPECCHVFHRECIDLWLASHTSCPVCRLNLDPVIEELMGEEGPDIGPDGPNQSPLGPGEENNVSYSITVKEETGADYYDRSPLQLQERRLMYGEGRFSRSHSTGHSIGRTNEEGGGMVEEDKYTLRLPEHVKETITRGHVQALSCTTFGEISRGGGQGRSYFGEI